MEPMTLEQEKAALANTAAADPFDDEGVEVSQDPAFVPVHHDDVAGPRGSGDGVLA